MKIKHASIKVIRFIQANHDLPGQFDTSSGIIYSDTNVPIRVLEMPDGELKIMIEVNDRHTSDEIKQAIPIAAQWRKRLSEIQGSDALDHDVRLQRERWIWEHESRRKSYAALAGEANKAIEDWIIFRVRLQEQEESLDYASRESALMKHFDMMNYAFTCSSAAGLNNAEWDEVTTIGLENARAGHPPFDKGYYPISSDKVRETLRYFKKTRVEQGREKPA